LPDAEHARTETAPAEFRAVPGDGRRITFRVLHAWGTPRPAHDPRERLARRREHRRPV